MSSCIWIPISSTPAFEKISKVYAKAGVHGHFQGVQYDGPHEFNVEMQEKAFAWLDRWLTTGGGETGKP